MRERKCMNDDLVDILLATYNSNENFLREQIDSLLNQTHKNIKITLVMMHQLKKMWDKF